MKLKSFLVLFLCVTILELSCAKKTRRRDTESLKAPEHKHEEVVDSKKTEGTNLDDSNVHHTSGSKSHQDQEKGKKGEHLVETHKKDTAEDGGKKTTHHHADHHHSSKKTGGSSSHAAKQQEGAKKKKTGHKKGFKEVFHKDEHKQHDAFYSNRHKSGQFETFGSKKAKHSSESATKKASKHKKNSKSESSQKKSRKSQGGKNKAEKKGTKSSKGGSTHYHKHEKSGSKGAKKGGKHFAFSEIPTPTTPKA